jgi:uncharacterized protein YkwD
MKRRLLLGLFVPAVVSIPLAGCLAPAPPRTVTALAADGGIVSELNAQRGAYGLPGLATSGDLTNLAVAWANHDASTGVLAHRDLNGIPGWAALGEVLFVGPCGTSDAAIVGAWMGSAEHRSIILNPVFRWAGAGRACTSDGRGWVVADLGAL